jgi:hypothetical protein
MSGDKIFVDTNILLYFLKGDQEVIEMLTGRDIVISFITELELLAFPKISHNSEKIIQGMLSSCTIIDIDKEIKALCIELRKSFKLKLPDALIAATSLKLNLPLITADKEFGKVDLLEVILYKI